jgi:hypothetical protein
MCIYVTVSVTLCFVCMYVCVGVFLFVRMYICVLCVCVYIYIRILNNMNYNICDLLRFSNNGVQCIGSASSLNLQTIYNHRQAGNDVGHCIFYHGFVK